MIEVYSTGNKILMMLAIGMVLSLLMLCVTQLKDRELNSFN